MSSITPLIALGQAAGLDMRLAWPIIGTSAAALAALVLVKVLMVDWLTLGEIVRRIERHHPGLNKLLETASEQISKNDPDKLDYLQQRVLTEALSAALFVCSVRCVSGTVLIPLKTSRLKLKPYRMLIPLKTNRLKLKQ